MFRSLLFQPENETSKSNKILILSLSGSKTL